MNIYEQISRNQRATWGLISIFLAFFLLMGLGLDYYYGYIGVPFFTLLALLVALVSSYGGYYYGDKLVLSSTHARELDLSDPKQQQWQNVVEEMSLAAGIPLPKTYIIDDPDPNAFATGRNPKHSSIVVTRGLLDVLNREELQAVASHEMSHIRNLDIRLMLMIAVLVGSVALLADWARRSLFYRGSRRSRDREGGVAFIILAIWLVTVILAPILSQIMAMFVSRRREYLADASGAELTRNPLSLVSALEKIERRLEPTSSINQGTAHLCIADPKGSSLGLKEGWSAELFSTHPPMAKRIATLKQMAYLK
jgi:heat shock protein HtpX